ncbi:MAG TPA: hypothetical protein VMV26_18220 [Alphaproteobacteria bacterium]|jgi:hypothetical protein|nr:hypothetical protein [Alphaproteobacteria bacterium]
MTLGRLTTAALAITLLGATGLSPARAADTRDINGILPLTGACAPTT